ncbi:MAG: hypothetical protein AAFQ04_10530, partial [Pseudomonadota bacterium]
FAALGQRQLLMDQLREWDLYRNDVLGDLRNRYDNEDDPMSKEELRDALKDIEHLNPEATSLSRQQVADAAPAPIQVTSGLLPSVLN